MNLNFEVREELGAVLKERAHAQGVSPDRIVRQVLEDTFAGDIQSPAEEHSPSSKAADEPTDGRPIWEVITDNMKDVPQEVMATLPKDGASQHDHYIYGWPKREA